MQLYHHKVQYYETDKMGITHHSNYVRWMEEARVDYLSQIGCGYDEMENKGIISPVLSVNCKYKKTTTFADEVAIRVKIKEFKGVRFVIEYEMTKTSDNSIVCTATSEHCFLDKDFKPVHLKRYSPEYYQKFMENVDK